MTLRNNDNSGMLKNRLVVFLKLNFFKRPRVAMTNSSQCPSQDENVQKVCKRRSNLDLPLLTSIFGTMTECQKTSNFERSLDV